MNQKKILEAYREELARERYQEWVNSLNEYCLMRYEPDFDYYTPGENFKYAWIRETDGDYFGLHWVDEVELNPEWLDDWEDMTQRPLVEPRFASQNTASIKRTGNLYRY